MRTRRRVLFAVGMAILLAVLTALLLLNGNVSAAIWMEGPYFPLTLLLPGSVDTLPTMVAVVAAYYFVCSLVALTCSSRRAAILVVSIVVVANTLGAYAWHRQTHRSAGTDDRTAEYAKGALHAAYPAPPFTRGRNAVVSQAPRPPVRPLGVV